MKHPNKSATSTRRSRVQSLALVLLLFAVTWAKWGRFAAQVVIIVYFCLLIVAFAVAWWAESRGHRGM